MTVEITFPVEFLVPGRPVSLQPKRPETRAESRRRIRRCCSAVLPEGHFATEQAVYATILYVPDGPMAGDIDNIVKPIMDALSGHVYLDDSQVERIWVQKFEPGRIFGFPSPSSVLTKAIEDEKPLTYVRLSGHPTEEFM